MNKKLYAGYPVSFNINVAPGDDDAVLRLGQIFDTDTGMFIVREITDIRLVGNSIRIYYILQSLPDQIALAVRALGGTPESLDGLWNQNHRGEQGT